MNILGIQSTVGGLQHFTSASIVIDGKVKGNYEEERFNRIKESDKFPYLAIERCLKNNGLTINDIDVVASPLSLDNLKEFFPDLTKDVKTIYHSHHMGHICSAFYQSGFKSAVCLIVDGCGDQNEGVTIAQVKNNEIKILKKFSIVESLGLLYTAGANYCNLGESGEGKLMGLAGYGTPNKDIPIIDWDDETNSIKQYYLKYDTEDILGLDDNVAVIFEYVASKISDYFAENIYPYSDSEKNNLMCYTNFAATIQYNYDKIMMKLAKYCKELTGEDNLVMSGGCANNCIANNLIVNSKLFKHFYIDPAPHDGGCALGYALYAAYELGEPIENKKVDNSYMGKVYTEEEISGLDAEYSDYDEDKTVSDLADNKIIGWFQGGAEFGPRALGHRSILSNPNSIDMLYKMNNIKGRATWRPLAPVVADELFDLIFDTDNYDLTEFMLRAMPIKESMKKLIVAVCHIDGTTRPQRLTKQANPELHSLLMNFYRKTGVPCLINTSFNSSEEPIIETPEQALVFLNTHDAMDSIIFNCRYEVKRRP